MTPGVDRSLRTDSTTSTLTFVRKRVVNIQATAYVGCCWSPCPPVTAALWCKLCSVARRLLLPLAWPFAQVHTVAAMHPLQIQAN